jgi:hypothetical protein
MYYSQKLQYSGVIYAGSGMLLGQLASLVYRFTIMSNDKKYHNAFISTKGQIIGFTIGQAIMFLLAFLTSKTFVSPETVQHRLSLQPPEIQEFIMPGEFIVWMDLTSDFTKYFLYSLLFLFAFIEILSLILIYLTLSTLKANNKKLSKNTLKLHKQLTLLLAFEFISPLLLIIVPLSTQIFGAIINEFSSREITRFLFILIGMYGLTNPILTILFIGFYRTHFVDTFIFPLLKIIGIGHLLPTKKVSPIIVLSGKPL